MLISFRLVAHPFFKANESNGRLQQNVNLDAIRRKSVNLAVMMFMHCRQRRLQRLSDCTDSNVIRNSFKGALCGMAPKKLFIKYGWKSKVSIIKVYILLLAKRVRLVQMLFDDLVLMRSANGGTCRIVLQSDVSILGLLYLLSVLEHSRWSQEERLIDHLK